MNNQPRVGIIVLNWNGLEDTLECLESLKKITYPNYKIIVVDNGSKGDDANILRSRYGGYIEVIANERNYGYPEGNNIGIRYALKRNVSYVLLLNNDVTVDPKFLTDLVKVAESSKNIGIAGSKILYYDQPNVIQTTGGKINLWSGNIKNFGRCDDYGQYDKLSDRDFVYGTSMLIKRSVIEKVSLLDASFFFGIEEYDYCQRAIKAGFRVVYVPQSKVYHKVGASRAKLTNYPKTLAKISKEGGFLNWKYSFRLFKKHLPAPLFILSFMLWGIRLCSYFASRFMIHLLKGNIRAIVRGIRNVLYRRPNA